MESYAQITLLTSYTEDIIAASSQPSEVIEINGVDAVKYVEDWIFQASFNQDADAAYNSMFYEKAFVAAGKCLSFYTRWHYPFPLNYAKSTAQGFLRDISQLVVESGTSIQVQTPLLALRMVLL